MAGQNEVVENTAVWGRPSWLGARPRTALWQTGGNCTHAVRSAVGRAVGRTAYIGGAGLWNRRQAHGVLAVQRQYSFRRQPEVTQRDKGVTTLTCFLPRGRRAQARSVGEGASPCQANLGVFHGRLLGRGVRAKGAGPSGRRPRFSVNSLFVCLFVYNNANVTPPAFVRSVKFHSEKAWFSTSLLTFGQVSSFWLRQYSFTLSSLQCVFPLSLSVSFFSILLSGIVKALSVIRML